MQLHQLEYFVAVARHRHFTEAAGELHVAQPSVSKQIRKLEQELGADLFHRVRGDVSLTAAGEVLLPWAQRILGDVGAAKTAVLELGDLRRGRLAIGATPSLSTILLPPLLGAFHHTYPGIELRLHEAGSQDLVRSLEHAELDLALVILPVDHAVSSVRSVVPPPLTGAGTPEGTPFGARLSTEALLEEELVVATAPDHPLAARRTVEVSDLRDVPLVMFRPGYDLRSATLSACRNAGFEPLFAMEGGEMDSVLRLTAAGVGVAVVPRMVVEPDGPLRAVRFAAPGLTRTIALAHRRDRPLSRAARAFTQSLRTALS